jgi:hypothetical protein
MKKCSLVAAATLHFDGVFSLVIADLEAYKAVDSSKRLSIMSGYSQLCNVLGVLCLVLLSACIEWIMSNDLFPRHP